MLTYMRTRSKTWVKWIIFGAIIIVFVFWGGSSYLGKDANMAAKVDRHIITNQQYTKAYQDAIKSISGRLGSSPSQEMIKALNLEERVLDQLIDDYILSIEAARAGVTVSEEDLQQAIQSFPPFQENGRFSPENYRRALEYQRLTPTEFEEQQKKEILKQKFYGLITENVVVSPEEVVSYYKFQNDVFNLNFLIIDALGFVKDITVTDQEAGIYYDKSKEKYQIPPKVTITCIQFPAAAYVSKVTVTPEEAQEYYDSHKSEFATEAKVHGKQILVAVPQDADETIIQQKLALAQKASEEAKGGGDFAALAAKYSDDPATKGAGGDLGLVPEQSLPDPLKEAFKKMKQGEVSAPVKSPMGFHVLKLESREEGKQASFEEVSASLTESLKVKRAKILAGDDADDTFKQLYEKGGANLAAFAQQKGLPVKEIGPFAKGDNIGVANPEEITKNAFLYPKGELGTVVDVGDGYLIYAIKDKQAARIPELSEVKDRVVQDLKVVKALQKAKAYASSLEKNRAQLDSMAHQTTGDFKRTAYAVPQLEQIPTVKDDLSKLGSPKTYAAGEKMYVVWLGSMKQADPRAAGQAQLKQVRDQLLRQKREMAVMEYQKEARKNHKVVIAKEMKRAPNLGDLPDNN